MRAVRLVVHNFRSIRDADLDLERYSLLVGPNNSGKSNLLAAVRAFYEKELKFEVDRDFPKFTTQDQESWVEIEYRCEADEFDQLKDEYRLADSRFRVRKYFKSETPDDEDKPRSGIYAYVKGALSGSRFYGAKNVQQAKLGDVIFIPAASKLDEHTKLTGPSALRELLNSVLKGVLAKSPSYKALTEAFAAFGNKVKAEEAHAGWSLEQVEKTISVELEDWGLQFALDINALNPDEVLKSLVGHHVIDGVLKADLAPSAFGQGFQRHLIFVLIRLAASYAPPTEQPKKKEFSPALTWLLFEEPEAFLHPAQMSILDGYLRAYAEQAGQQVSVSTHNPLFASRSMDDLPAIARLSREGVMTATSQVKADQLDALLAANQACINDLKNAGVDVTVEDETIAMESIKYALWLNPLRAAAFFAERVLLVEGASEYALFSFLIGANRLKNPRRGITIIDTLGKWNTHRFMNILGALCIPHSVLIDRDGGGPRSVALQNAINAAKNGYTRAVDAFDEDLEAFLGVPKTARADRKPQHLMWRFQQGQIDPARIDALIAKVQPLLDA